MPVPLTPHNDTYVVNQSGAASWYGPWFDCATCHQIGFTVSWSAVAATAGTLAIEGTDDTSQAVAGAGGANVVTLTVSTSHGTFPTVGTTAANAMVRLENPPHWVRLKYTRSAGGGASQFQAFAHGRSV